MLAMARNLTLRRLGLTCLLTLMLAAVPARAQEAPGPGIFALQTMLGDRSPEIRVRAARALRRVGGRRAVLILRRGLSDRTVAVRIAVIEALGFIGGTLALTVLSEALKDRAPEIRIRAVEALKAAVPASLEIVERATHAEDPAFVRECVDRLIDLIEAEPDA